jgi:YgiT-type zinc finger domain-containing protein
MKSADPFKKIEWIAEKAKKSYYQVSEHVMRFLTEGKISTAEIEDAISSGKILEVHKHPSRGISYLVLGFSGKKPVHVICAETQNSRLVILFAYIPSPPIWKNSYQRSQSGAKSVEDKLQKCFFCNGEIKQITVGNFDYRLEGQLYVVKNVPAGLCVQCGEKYISASSARIINDKIEAGRYAGTEKVFILEY